MAKVVPEKPPPVPDCWLLLPVGDGTPEVVFETETGPTVVDDDDGSVTVVSDIDVTMMMDEVDKELVALPFGTVLVLASGYVTVYVVAVTEVEMLSVELFE